MTLWNVFTDVCLMGTLLLIGQILRAKVCIFQRLLIPPALIAGFLALLLGPNGLKLLPFSDSLGGYASLLIVLIFAAMPIGDRPKKENDKSRAVGGMFVNVTGIAVLQYGAGLLLSLYVLDRFFPLNDGFGLMLATGFYGGHGTAAAVGSTFADLGWPEATDIAMTMATIGIVGGIISGIIIINWGARRGYTHYVAHPNRLSKELRTGLVEPEAQKAGGKLTVSSICLDPMAFHLALVLVPSLLGYYTTKALGKVIPAEIPAFCSALLFGFLLQLFLKKSGTLRYVDRSSITRISGTATDFLIISGVGSVKIALVMAYAVPMLIMSVAGFIMTWLWFMLIGAHCSDKDWFERNMMVWGHATGVVATGVLLQRVVDPELKSRGIEDSGISDLLNRPLLVALQAVPPLVVTYLGRGWVEAMGWIMVALCVVMLAAAWKFGWWRPKEALKRYR